MYSLNVKCDLIERKVIIMTRKDSCFTLVEVLIVIVVIGVVCAITLPTLITNFNKKIKAERIENINAKLYQGTDQVMVLDHINSFTSENATEEFVKELSSYFKISLFCSDYIKNGALNTCSDTTWDSRGASDPNCSKNYWATDRKYFNDLGMTLPDIDTLGQIYCQANGLTEKQTYYYSRTGASNGVGWSYAYINCKKNTVLNENLAAIAK